MASAKIFALVSTFAILNAATAQVINRVLPYGNVLPLDLLPNQVYVNSPVLPVTPNLVNLELPVGVETILSAPVTVPGTTTIIQDSTVANNLANALQLLVVSNLLSNTLPYMGADVVPCAAPVEVLSPLSYAGLPAGYSYVY